VALLYAEAMLRTGARKKRQPCWNLCQVGKRRGVHGDIQRRAEKKLEDWTKRAMCWKSWQEKIQDDPTFELADAYVTAGQDAKSLELLPR